MRTTAITISLKINAKMILSILIVPILLRVVDGRLGGNNKVILDETVNSTVSSYIIDMDNMQSMIDEASDIYTAKTCVDFHTDCPHWAREGGCIKDPLHLLSICPKSCNSCGFIPNPEDSKKILKYGVNQRVEGDMYVEVLKNIQSTVSYMERLQLTSTLSEETFSECRNEKEFCAFWASSGECELNNGFMTEHCSPSCQSCNLIDYATRCPHRDPHLEPAVGNSELDDVFETIVSLDHLDLQIHSRPKEDVESTDYKQRPWVITIDDFLSTEECDTMIELGYGKTLKNPVIAQEIDGSTNSYCMDTNGCYNHATVQAIYRRLSSFLEIPIENFDHLDINKITSSYSRIKYHNYGKDLNSNQCGSAVISIHQFLSDAPMENQGGITFPVLNKTIAAKKGRIVIWPNVINSDMYRKDIRMYYYYQGITDGIMYCLRLVGHLYDYVTPHARGCIQ